MVGFSLPTGLFQTYAEQDLRRSQSWLYGPQVDLSGKDLGFEYTPVFPEENITIVTEDVVHTTVHAAGNGITRLMVL